MVPFVLEGQCTTAKGVGPLLEQILSVRGTGTHPLCKGMVFVSAAQQGALCCQPNLLGREEKLPRGEGCGWGSTPAQGTYRILQGASFLGYKGGSHLEHGSRELGMAPRSHSPWCACVGRSQGQQEMGWSLGLGLKMQFFFFVQPSGGDLGGIILQTQKST